MAHATHFAFFRRVRKRFPRFFVGDIRVLDIGSLDINGNNRRFFRPTCRYVGLDLGEGRNVDVVCVAHEYAEPSGSFDVVLSSNALEHDMYFAKTLVNMVRLVRPGGLMFFQATHRYRAHGLARKTPQDSPFTSKIPGWDNYFRNVTVEMVREVLDLETLFTEHLLEYPEGTKDIAFWGVRSDNSFIAVPSDKSNAIHRPLEEVAENVNSGENDV